MNNEYYDIERTTRQIRNKTTIKILRKQDNQIAKIAASSKPDSQITRKLSLAKAIVAGSRPDNKDRQPDNQVTRKPRAEGPAALDSEQADSRQDSQFARKLSLVRAIAAGSRPDNKDRQPDSQITRKPRSEGPAASDSEQDKDYHSVITVQDTRYNNVAIYKQYHNTIASLLGCEVSYIKQCNLSRSTFGAAPSIDLF